MKKSRTSGGEHIALLPSGAIATYRTADAGASSTEFNFNDTNNSSAEWADWGGTDNDWPTKARKKLEKSTTAYPLLWKAVCLLFGDGVVYYTEEADGEKLIKKFDKIPEIDEFFEANSIDTFLIEQLMDYKFFANQFYELIFNQLGTKVVNIYHKEAEFCRVSVQNPNTFRIEKLGYSGDWKEGNPATINLIDKHKISTPADIVEQSKAGKNKLAGHTMFPSPGKKYYGFPPHGALYRKDGWLDYSNSVPEVMNKMITNQLKIKFHIEIPYDYWPATFSDWSEKTEVEKMAAINAELDKMDKWLQSSANAYGTFISHYATDPITGKYISGWKITAIDDKLKKDEWIPGTQEADQQIARAINIDSSMSNIQPAGGKMGAGSGSDKRTSFINAISLSKAEEKIVFEPLDLVKRINGWPSNIKFGFRHTAPTKLDENPTSNESVM